MWKLSTLILKKNDFSELSKGIWIPARPLNEDYKPLTQRIKEAWLVLRGKVSVFTWD